MTRKQYLSKWWSTGMLKNMSNGFLNDLSLREKLSVCSRKPGARGVGNFSEAEYRGVFGMNHFQSNSLLHDHLPTPTALFDMPANVLQLSAV